MNELLDLLETTGYSISEEVNDDLEVSTPYIVFGIDEQNIIADDVVYYSLKLGKVDLYRRRTDKLSEPKVENILKDYSWQKTIEYLDEENLMVTHYTIRL